MLLRPAAHRRSSDRPLVAAVLAFALVASLAPGASASTRSKLSDAKSRLTSLTEQIKADEARVLSMQNQLADLNARVAAATARERQIKVELAATQTGIENAKAQLAMLQAKFDSITRAMFMSGPGGPQAAFLGSMLASTSMTDVLDRVAFASAVSQADIDLATQVSTVKAGLVAQAANQSRLLAKQATLLSSLHADQVAQAKAVASERQAVAALATTKKQILDLIVRLRKELRAEEIAGIGGIFQGPDHITYGAWSGLFLRTMGVPTCHSNMVALVSWQVAEFTQAAWNPLATTHPMPGSTLFNSSGVQNYRSLGQGLQASKATIVDGSSSYGYGAIVSTLSRCSDAMTTARAINASAWCRGCAGGTYVIGYIRKVEAHYGIYAAL